MAEQHGGAQGRGMDEARRRIVEAARTGAEELDLGGLGLTEIPEELYAPGKRADLSRVKTLYLGAPKRLLETPYRQRSEEDKKLCNAVRALPPALFASMPHLNSLHLDLNGLTSLPVEIAKLTALTSLNLWNNGIGDEGASALAGLTTLTSLNLWGNGIGAEGASALTGLATLTSLDLWGNGIGPGGTKALAGLTALTALNLSGNDIGDEGATALAGLTALTALDLAYNSIGAEGATALAGLTALTSLNLWDNRIGNEGATALAGLTALTALDLSGNGIGANGATALAGFTALTSLYLSGNDIGDEGTGALAGLTTLTSLNLRGNRIGAEGAQALSGLTALTSLDLSGNEVGDLSFALNLTRLKKLTCSGSRLEHNFRELWRMPSLKEVVLHEATLPGVPPEILSPDPSTSCLDKLRAHFADLEGGVSEVADFKLMILGNGRVGKTQICRRLKGEAYDESVKSTHGVQISAAPLRLDRDDTATLRIWDFGGQDIYHGTHALFLKSRAIFPVVWTPEAEAEQFHEHGGFTYRNQPLGYWLAYVRAFGGKRSPVLVIQTQCDEPEQERLRPPVPDEGLEPFPFRKLLHYSAKTDRGRGALDEALADAVRWLRRECGADQIGTGRAEVKARLERLYASGTQLMRQAEFLALCEEVRAEGQIISSEPLLLDYLHNIGTVFYREGLFGDAIILDQAWALDAVYAVFDRESKAFRNIERFGGRFRRSDLADWVWKDFSIEEQELFLTFMRQCGICFKVRDGDRGKGIEAEYIAPDLLPKRDDPEIAAQLIQKWDGRGDAEAALSYELLPPGLMRSLISKIGEEAGLAAEYWRDGVLFYDRETGGKALVEQRLTEGWAGEIHVRTKGGQAEALRQRVLALIDERHDVHGARPGSRTMAAGNRHPELAEGPSSAQRLAPAHEPSATPQYFVSYAWGDETGEGREWEAVIDRLCAAAEARGITIIRDKTAMHYGERISVFMDKIARGVLNRGRIFIMLSDKYLRSPYCMTELFDVWRNCREDDAEFIARTRVYVMESARIKTPADRADYAIHWRQRFDETHALVSQHGQLVLSDKDNADYRRMTRFVNDTANILALIQDVLKPRTFEEFLRHGFDQR